MQNENIHFMKNFDSQEFENVSLRGQKFFYCSFNHAHFGANVDLYGSVFVGCSFQYLEASNILLDHFSAHDCDFRHANFQSSTFRKSRTHKCDFTSSNLKEADLKRLSGEGSDFKLSKIEKSKSINVLDRDMISELVRCQANGDTEVLMVAALVKNSFEFCWREWKTMASLPQWKRPMEIVYKILNKYPFISNVINSELRG